MHSGENAEEDGFAAGMLRYMSVSIQNPATLSDRLAISWKAEPMTTPLAASCRS